MTVYMVIEKIYNPIIKCNRFHYFGFSMRTCFGEAKPAGLVNPPKRRALTH